jgi:hypothetical protein
VRETLFGTILNNKSSQQQRAPIIQGRDTGGQEEQWYLNFVISG